TTSVSGAANSLVSQVGVITQQAQNNATTQQTVNQNATTALNNVSGVNLDQEAAKMLQYQQAYQAMAQVIQASGQMFTSLINAIGGYRRAHLDHNVPDQCPELHGGPRGRPVEDSGVALDRQQAPERRGRSRRHGAGESAQHGAVRLAAVRHERQS